MATAADVIGQMFRLCGRQNINAGATISA